ncbi:hypothetical protein C2S52_003290 [Perilla frutescens var. hirtella]|nr:hypothetical protein C2S51_012202 [Perilla frutescens var. frutescens]KAH6792813.1 hypothetical protein C2S52_003290 [Perilla frutescens var. hirtella]
MFRNKQPQKPTESKNFKIGRENVTPDWRTQIKQTQLVSQASTVLLQRHPKFWASLLKPLKFSSNFTPSLFHQILNRIRTQPKICFDFFNWARKNLDFKPDLGAQCELTRILFGSELFKLGKPILSSIIQEYPSAKIAALFQPRRDAVLQNMSPVLNYVIGCYCSKQMYFQSLEFYRMFRSNGVGLSVNASNKLLNLLGDKNELRLAWCFFASIVRDGVSVSGNHCTWDVIAKILYKDGKFERIGRILDVGVYTPEMFDFIIDGYSKRGNFVAAFDYLDEVWGKGIEPSFSTYSSILDGACRYHNREVIENILSYMVEKGHISKPPASDYDLIIKKLCDVGKTFAMELFFKRACDDDVELEHATYECMFRALLFEEGRVENAIELYNILQGKNISISKSCYNEFVIALCRENPSLKISNLLVDIIRRGGISPAKDLSNYISKQCAECRWREAEELLSLVLDQGWLLDPLCWGSFVRHYCSTRQIDRAIVLHNKLEELNGTLETATINILLAGLFREGRVEEAIRVFDYMKICKTVDSDSFALMIRGLCCGKEMRKAMKLHDEMLELGLKPDQRKYKRLISGFG